MIYTSIDHRKLPSIFFTITWKKYEQNWLYFSVEKARALHLTPFFFVCTLIDNSYEPISAGILTVIVKTKLELFT